MKLKIATCRIYTVHHMAVLIKSELSSLGIANDIHKTHHTHTSKGNNKKGYNWIDDYNHILNI